MSECLYPEDADVESPELLYWVGVYLTDRAYGGPEEGGWYYDCGELVTDKSFFDGHSDLTPRSFINQREAYDFGRQIDDWLNKTHNVNRHPVSSVLSEGIYASMVMEGFLPKHYPETRPHYE